MTLRALGASQVTTAGKGIGKSDAGPGDALNLHVKTFLRGLGV